MNRILVCDPEFFDVNYEINPWMSTYDKPNTTKAKFQWEDMISSLVKSGAQIERIQPDPCYPDMVFTANAGIVRGNKVVLSNYRHPQRQGEKELFRRWFLDHGYEVIELPPNIFFEGEGDALFFYDTLFMGYGVRTDKKAHPIVAEALGVKYVSCELIAASFYHLDTCLFVTENNFVYYKEAFGKISLSNMLKDVVDQTTQRGSNIGISSVDRDQARRFICNSMKVNHNIITPTDSNYGVFYVPTSSILHCDMSEFIKSGGAIKCLTLRL